MLIDDAIRVFWTAADAMGYPYGPLYKLWCASGQRRSDWGQARWSEIDWISRSLIIPASRFKSDVNFTVPFSELIEEILAGIPRFEGPESGDYIFSYCNGLRPVNSFGQAKIQLDELMATELRRLAVLRGENPADVVLKHFTNHDLRRVVRTCLTRPRTLPKPLSDTPSPALKVPTISMSTSRKNARLFKHTGMSCGASSPANSGNTQLNGGSNAGIGRCRDTSDVACSRCNEVSLRLAVSAALR